MKSPFANDATDRPRCATDRPSWLSAVVVLTPNSAPCATPAESYRSAKTPQSLPSSRELSQATTKSPSASMATEALLREKLVEDTWYCGLMGLRDEPKICQNTSPRFPWEFSPSQATTQSPSASIATEWKPRYRSVST